MAAYDAAIEAAFEDIVQRVYTIREHIVDGKWEHHEDSSPIDENPGSTRLFSVALIAPRPETMTTFSTVEDIDTEFSITIGYDRSPEHERAAAADLVAIKHNLADGTYPDGISFYDAYQNQPLFERLDDFMWVTLSVIVRSSTTTS